MSDDPMGWPYDVLGLDTAHGDTKTIKRAYARRLKAIDQAKDPAGFQALREAYEFALETSKHGHTAPISLQQITEPIPEIPTSEPSPADLEPDTPDPAPTGIKAEALDEGNPTSAVEESGLGLSNEDRERWDALNLELQSLLVQPFDNARWATLTRDPLLDVFEFANEMEHSIFGGVFTRMEVSDNGERILPPFVTPRWIELIDQRFGWTQDLPLFQRKFGWHGGTVLPLLSQRAHFSAKQAPPVQTLPVTTRRSWIQTTVMLCAGYTLLRALVLVVLP